ncbi:hypothetical protein ACLOJK_041947, partial [Asimina triloba]
PWLPNPSPSAQHEPSDPAACPTISPGRSSPSTIAAHSSRAGQQSVITAPPQQTAQILFSNAGQPFRPSQQRRPSATRAPSALPRAKRPSRGPSQIQRLGSHDPSCSASHEHPSRPRAMEPDSIWLLADDRTAHTRKSG